MSEVKILSATATEGPGSWGFEGPEAMKLRFNRRAGTSSIKGEES